MKRILITGANGMLGHRLVLELSSSFEVHATLRRNTGLEGLGEGPLLGAILHPGVDLQSEIEIEELVKRANPDAVVNAAGMIKQKVSEQSGDSMTKLNSLLPKTFGRLAKSGGFRFISISTDCVFSGAKGQYAESDVPDCTDEYGLSKLAGENCGEDSLVLRTSIVGRELSGAYGLLEWFLSMRGNVVKGFENAFFSGLSTNELARVVHRILDSQESLSGLHNVAGNRISKADFLELANELFESNTLIERVTEPSIDRSLDASRFNRATNYTPPSWREMLSEISQLSDTYERWRIQKF